MKIKLVSIFALTILLFSSFLNAMGLEVSLGGSQQTPSGELSFKGNTINIQKDLRYDKKNVVFGRVRLDLPLVPNIYITANPLRFEETGQKDATFKFGDLTFRGGVPFESSLKLDHYDLGFFYGIPFIETLTREKLNIDIGVNARVIDFKAEISQTTTALKQSKSQVVPVPMGFLALELRPLDWVHLETELRGFAYEKNQFIDTATRLKFKFLKIGFISAGYKYQMIQLDRNDVVTDLQFGGPTLELGIDL